MLKILTVQKTRLLQGIEYHAREAKKRNFFAYPFCVCQKTKGCRLLKVLSQMKMKFYGSAGRMLCLKCFKVRTESRVLKTSHCCRELSVPSLRLLILGERFGQIKVFK